MYCNFICHSTVFSRFSMSMFFSGKHASQREGKHLLQLRSSGAEPGQRRGGVTLATAGDSSLGRKGTGLKTNEIFSSRSSSKKA